MRINGIYTLFLAIATALAIVSCGEDRTYEYLEKTEENQWTYSKMKEFYLPFENLMFEELMMEIFA